MDPRVTATSVVALEASLDAELNAIEEQTRYDVDLDERYAQAGRIGAAARTIARTDLRLRVELIQSDIVGRRGDIIASGQSCQQVNTWATEHGHLRLMTLSHLRLSLYFGPLGDFPTALEHAVRAMTSVSAMGDAASTHLRLRCVMALADALADSGDIAGSRLRYAEAERLSATRRDVRGRIRVFNNLAFTEHQAGDGAAAKRAVDHILSLAAEHRLSLDYNTLDTVATVQLDRGCYGAAVATLQPALDDAYAAVYEEVSSRAQCLLTLATVHRLAGGLGLAQAALDRCRMLCEHRQLLGVAVDLHREQSEILAATGRFAEALEAHKAFHTAAMALTSREREARAKTLHTLYEADEARRAGAQAQELSLRDPLTGLFNRRFVDAEMPVLLGRAEETHAPLSVAIVDLDYFKRINDTCSHEVGDEVLRVVARLMIAAVGVTGGPFAARLGGEEFLLVLPNTDAGAAFAWAERLRESIGDHDWRPVTGTVPVTASIGVATRAGGHRTQEELVREADIHLYAAKEGGRNRVVDGSSRAFTRQAA